MRLSPVLVAASTLACQAQGVEMRGVEVVVRNPRGGVEMTLRRTSTGCIYDETLAILAHSEGITADGWSLARGPTGRELRGPEGLIARVVDEPGPPRRLSLVDPVGVPMARINFDPADPADPANLSVTVSDASRAPVARVERSGRGFQLLSNEQVAATVTGTDDPELAARLLVAAPIPGEARALFACGRLAVTTPAVK